MYIPNLPKWLIPTPDSFVTALYLLCKLSATVCSAEALVIPEVFLVTTTLTYFSPFYLPMIVLLQLFTCGSDPTAAGQSRDTSST